jgi:nucleotide-binding universal stress UspA family protein
LRGDQPPNIVVGIDSSDVSRDALSLALREAAVRGGRVHALTAWQPADVGTAGKQQIEHWRRAAQQVQDRQVSAVIASMAPAVPIFRELAMGEPGEILVNAARGAELLVVGSRQHLDIGRAFGSVSEYCAKHSPVPLVVVPHAR